MNKLGVWGLVVLLAGCAAVPVVKQIHSNPDALWQVNNNRCHVAADAGQGDCIQVSPQPDKQSVVLKDRHGRSQYLLLPLQKITGIEDPQVLAVDAPNYFAQAWLARTYSEQALGQPLPRRYTSLAANSPHGRSQEQLHIHIDCVRADVAEALQQWQGTIGLTFAPLPGELRGHRYLARYVPGTELPVNPFQLLAQILPPGDVMADYSMAVVGVEDARGPGFDLLATRYDLLDANFASAEELQDHACGVITGEQALDGVR